MGVNEGVSLGYHVPFKLTCAARSRAAGSIFEQRGARE
jgi:hypothetical protein